MKCVCVKKCFIDDGTGKVRRYNPGQVIDVDKCPAHFSSLEEDSDAAWDFLTASAEELKARTWTFNEAAEAISEAYDIDLFKEEGTTKADVVAQIMDARERHIEVLTRYPENT